MSEHRRFTWDEDKALANERKHGVSFEEAQDAFLDEQGVLEFDEGHSKEEDRFVLIAMSPRLRVLFIVHADIGEEFTRIISARRANSREKQRYEQRKR